MHESFAKEQQISHLCFNKQAFKPIHFDIQENALFFISDTENKENYNIFKLSLKTKDVISLTNSKYVVFSHFSKKGQLIYGDRTDSENGMYTTSVKIRTQYNKNDIEMATDKNDIYRFTWGKPVFSNDEKSLLVSIDKENKRQKFNILHIDLEYGKRTRVLPEEYESTAIWPLPIEFSNKGFLYVSNISGFDNIYYHDFIRNKEIKLSDLNNKNNGISILKNNRELFLVVAIPCLSRDKTIIHFYKLATNRNKVHYYFHLELDGNIYLFSDHCDYLWTEQSTFSSLPSLRRYALVEKELKLNREFHLYSGSKKSLVHTTHKYLTYKSFDDLDIPAFLALPTKSLKGALITAFYGGYNYYDSQTQIFAELGWATLSPAVRGSFGFGKEWENHIQGDLGGNEILDIVWAARFLEKELGLPPEKIGLEGRSHGGYAVLRALTMPDHFNSQKSKYPFGFGICWAGFADLVDFYHTSNIPDWLVHMLGDYEDNKQKYFDRSPINHFDELNAPIFILHGTHDNRVNPSSMENFIHKLKKSNKTHFVHMIEGQGHTSGSKKEKVRQYKNMFNFFNM